ncbi:helix-turn-helix domain-containing protein [Bacillus sp. T3]|uniref:helix-turn-helix domain-containing protein n=1 Tax=Bacillus sp. T3 TaxID=467262 RepID=UPI003993952D
MGLFGQQCFRKKSSKVHSTIAKTLLSYLEEGINFEDVEISFVRQALERSKGNQTQAAKLLGMSRHALIYRMDKFNLK